MRGSAALGAGLAAVVGNPNWNLVLALVGAVTSGSLISSVLRDPPLSKRPPR